jgi:O-antigen ligase
MRNIVILFTLIFVSFIPWEGVIQFPLMGGAVRIAGIVMSVFWLLKVVINRRLRKPNMFHFLVSCFVVWNALSIFWSGDIDSSLDHVITWAQILIMTLIFWDLFTSEILIHAALQAYILGAYVAIGNTLKNYFLGDTFYYGRFSPVGTNPDDLGTVLALGIPLAWYLASSFKPDKISFFLKIINYSYIPASLFGMSLSGTRTAIIASIPGMAFGFLSLMQFKIWTRIFILTSLLVIIFAALPFVETLPSYQRLGTTSSELTAGNLSGRTILWREGLNTFKDHPIIGIGCNMYRSITTVGKVAHNTYISVLVELGLIGITLFAFIILYVVKRATTLPRPHSLFWLTQIVTWGICASTLTMEHRKPTWLFFSLVISSSSLWLSHENKQIE